MVNPSLILKGVTVIIAPHMDDAVLACGGIIAQLPQKNKIHIVYATDGSRSPHAMFPRYKQDAHNLTKIRIQEAKAALKILGVSETNLHFLNYPDGQLKHYASEFSNQIIQLIQKVEANQILIPFRYDSHPDHLAVNRLTTRALQKVNQNHIARFEYFVYYRLRLLPGQDLRKYINPHLLYRFDINHHSDQKRTALQCFKSQVTRFYDWQDRPILTQELIEEVCRNQEMLLKNNNTKTLNQKETLFIKYRNYIPLVHYLEPALKAMKDKMVLIIKLARKSLSSIIVTN